MSFAMSCLLQCHVFCSVMSFAVSCLEQFVEKDTFTMVIRSESHDPLVIRSGSHDRHKRQKDCL